MNKILLFEQWNAVNEVGDASAKPYKWKADTNIKKGMQKAVDAVLKKGDYEHDEHSFDYFFKNDDGLEYIISFKGWVQNMKKDATNIFSGEIDPNRVWDSSFNIAFNTLSDHKKGVENETNLGDMFRIMATVTEVAFNFLEESEKSGYPVKTLTIAPKGDTENNNGMDSRRGRIYLAYIKKQMKRLKTKSDYTAMFRRSDSGFNVIHIAKGKWSGGGVIEKVDKTSDPEYDI